MKVKDLERTANVAWSPADQDSVYLAAGTAAQQLDASFNTNACLEIYSLNLGEPGMDLELQSSTSSDQRFYKIVWGGFGSGDQSSGTIVGSCDDGLIQIYDAGKLLKGESGALVSKQNKHSGPVHSLDFNPFQSNLLATGASESEIYIWDMNNTANPMTPGAKSQPYEDVLSIAWNRQVQHILASTFSTKCVVWDLRKNEPIIKLSDTVSRIRWKVVAWHPDVATQLCLASEEDQAPIIQLWDLRFATSPLRTMENHQRGVLSIDWCSQDSDILISCGKDNRIICWNPNSDRPGGEVLSEVARTNQWNFDISWCPKNPALVASPCFDGHVSIYSLMGGKTQQIVTSNKIADSFPGMEGYVQAPQQQQAAAPVSVDLTKPPKWLKKPVGASFGFGGKLITFEHDKAAIVNAQQNLQPGQAPPKIPRTINISQVVTEMELVQKSAQLEQALEYGNFIEYCRDKAEATDDQHKKYIWHFLKANFEQSPRAELLNLLGYKIEDVNAKLNEVVGNQSNDVNGLTDGFSTLNKEDRTSVSDDPFSRIAQTSEENKTSAPYKIKTGSDSDGLITQAILMGNVEAAVELCLKAKRFADAIIIAMTGGSDLLAKTQFKYFQQSEGYVSSLISALVSEDWLSVINGCEVNSWREALTATLTHASDEDLPLLCEQMGDRLIQESDGNKKLLQDAQLCYICAGSFEKLVSTWSGDATKSTRDLQELVELVTFLQKAVERQGRTVEVAAHLADLLSHYASLLASQGSLATALNYLGTSQNEQVASLRERLYVSLGHKPAYAQPQQPRTRQNSSRQSFSAYSNQTNPFTQSQFGQNQFGQSQLGQNQLGHNQLGQNQLGQNQLGQNQLGHNQLGQNQLGQNQLGQNQFGQNQLNQSNQFNSGNQINQFNQPGPFSPPAQAGQTNYNQFNTGLPNAATNQPWQNQNAYNPMQQPPKPFSPAPPTAPPTQPPRPTSVGSTPGLPKSKYVLDPSVTTNQYGSRNMYGANSMNNPMSNSLSNPMSNALSNPMSNALNNPMSNALNNPMSNALNNPMSNSLNPVNPLQPTPSGIPTSGRLIPSMAQQPSQQGYQNAGFNQPNESAEIGQSALNALPSSAAPGWNDPPVLNKPLRSQQKQEMSQQDPITHPIFGAAPVQQYPNNNGYIDPNQNAQYNQGPPTQMFQPAPPTSGFNQPLNFNTAAVNQGNFNQNALNTQQNQGPGFQGQGIQGQGFQGQGFQGQTLPGQPLPGQILQGQTIQPEPPAPVQKGPIPEEHLHMKTVFDELITKCSCAANNPQTKRKIDDVSKKLESLYDLLREHKLSANTLGSLHQIVQLIQVGDYAGGLNLHTQLVSGPDFSQIASFMPGVKVLLQCALQLQVYIR